MGKSITFSFIGRYQIQSLLTDIWMNKRLVKTCKGNHVEKNQIEQMIVMKSQCYDQILFKKSKTNIPE
jgi:hypothetical protein